MTYLQILNLIKDAAKAQPNIHSIVREFTDLNREDTVYSAVVIQDRDGSRDVINSDDYVTYTWHLGYVDRLTEEKVDESEVCKYYSNRDDIYSTGMNVINNIVATLRKNYYPELDINIIDRFNTFNQRFTAECAGVYVVLAVNVQVSDCVDEPGDMYDSLSVSIGENGSYQYTPDDRPWNSVMISVDVSGGGQKPEMIGSGSAAVGPDADTVTYYPPEGNVFSRFDVNPVIANSLSVNISEPGHYHYTPLGPGQGEEAFSEVNVEVEIPSGPLSETITENGEYYWDPYPDPDVDFYNEVYITVSVPSDAKPETICDQIIEENGSFHYTPASGEVYRDVHITANVHPSVSLVRNITSNGSYSYPGDWAGAEITVAVSGQKPEESLIQSISSNGSYHFDPSVGAVFSGADITVSVHPNQQLIETIASNGVRNFTGEWSGATITVSVPTTVTVVMSQAAYNDLSVKDPDTIYLING